MNVKTTIFFVFLAAICAALLWKGTEIAPRLGLASRPVEVADHGTAAELEKLAHEKITRIEIKQLGEDKSKTLVTLAVPKNGETLELLGNWPVRRYEVDELVSALTHLKSRYQPIPLGKDAELKSYGLDPSQHPTSVTIQASGGSHVLLFGQEELKPGENPFLLPTYVRVGDRDEVLRLGPDIMPLLKRSEETYRRRQLFPEIERVKIADSSSGRGEGSAGSTVMLLGDQAKQIDVDGPLGKFVLERLAPTPAPIEQPDKPSADLTVSPEQIAQSWALTQPVRDRVDPAKLRAILAAIPELMVQNFDEKAVPWFKTGLAPVPIERFLAAAGAAMPALSGEGAAAVAAGLAVYNLPPTPVPQMTVLVNGSPRTLYVGSIAHSNQRVEREQPMFPGQPPQTRLISEDFIYGKLGDNPIIFELKDDRLKDLLVLKSSAGPGDQAKAVDQLRDPNLARFDSNQVARIEISQVSNAGGPKPAEHRFEIVKIKGDPNATGPKGGEDRWELLTPIKDQADTSSVTELLDALKGMEARKENIVDGPPPAALVGFAAIDPRLLFGLTPELAKKVTLTFDAKSGLKPVTFLIGPRDPATNKRAVAVEGWQRINIVDDRLDSQQTSRFDRQPSSYRTLKLFDPAVSKIEEIVVQRSAADMRPADTFTLQEQPGPPPKWSITAPFKADADSIAANQLATELGNLGTQKYVYDPATDQPLTIKQWPPLLAELGVGPLAGDALFGFDMPILTLVLKFKEPKGAEDIVIEVGRPRSDTEYYARRKGSAGVFAISDRVVKAANQKPEDLVDKTLFHFASKPEVQSIRRQMGGQDFEIIQNNSALWEIAKPFQAKADQAKVDEFAQQLGQLRASRIEAVAPKNLKDYGLEPPVAVVLVEALDKSKLVTKTLLVGNPVDAMNPEGDRFVKTDDSAMVAVLPGAIAQKLIAEPGKFRDLSIGGFVTADKIVLEKGDRKITFVKSANGWKVSEPVQADAEDEELRELHDQLAKLRAEELVEDKPKDLTKYGLDKPAHWRIFNGDREVMHLLVGAHEKVGPQQMQDGLRAYAKLGNGDAVFLLNWRLSHLLSSEFRKRAVWDRADPLQISEISVKAPAGKDSFTFVKGPLGWTDAAKPDDKLNQELVNDLLLGLAGLRIDHYVVDKDANLAKFGLDKPRIVTVTAADGKKRVLLLGNLFDGKYIFAKLDDPARTDVFLLNETDSLSLKRPRADYAINKKEEPKKEEPKKEELKKEEPKKDQK